MGYDVDIEPAKCCSVHDIFMGDQDHCPGCLSEWDRGEPTKAIVAQPAQWGKIKNVVNFTYVSYLRYCAKRAHERYCT